MIVSYSGIRLECVQSEIDRTPVLDDSGTDFLYTQVVVRCVAVINSDQVVSALRENDADTMGTSYIRELGGAELSSNPDRATGIPSNVRHSNLSSPVITDRAIRHWLSVPRRKLLVYNEGMKDRQYLIECPKEGFLVDAKNGPTPEVHDIQQVHGDAKTFMVAFSVKAFISECEENFGTASALLSHRFSQTHSYDEDFFQSITTRGVVRFRTDLVYGKINPDRLREYAFNPIPPGFKRHIEAVETFPDATGFSYQYTDHQEHQQLVVGQEVNATRAEMHYRCAVLTSEDQVGTVLDSVDRHYSNKANRRFAREGDEKQKKVKKSRKPPKP